MGKEFGEKLEGYSVIKEGEAKILRNSSNSVFYNRAQVNNRDLSIAVLRTFTSKRKEEHAAMLSKKDCDMQLNQSLEEPQDIIKETRKTTSCKGLGELEPPGVLEALAASGLRSIRYALEVDGIGQVVALDRDKVSVGACMKNLQLNGSVACSKVEVHHADARVYMLTHPKEFDAVDLDPYGSPSVFLDSAVQSVTDGGMLMCSATDLAVLCGNNGDVCYSKYGSYPLKGKYCHEMALRILLACIESHANRYKRFIVPVLSVHMDFYIRVFVRIFTSASEMKSAPLKLSYVYQCVGCDSYHLQGLGRTTANKELLDVPLFVSLHSLCATLKCTTPSAAMFPCAVTNAGYRISGSHTTPLGLKTDAPMTAIWDILRCWVKHHPVKVHPPGQSGTVILSKEPTLQANFSQGAVSLTKIRAKRGARFLPNPKKYWGPNIRAGRQITSKHTSHLFPESPEENGASQPVVEQETDSHTNREEGNEASKRPVMTVAANSFHNTENQ